VIKIQFVDLHRFSHTSFQVGGASSSKIVSIEIIQQKQKKKQNKSFEQIALAVDVGT
jgi:hypothetical protein